MKKIFYFIVIFSILGCSSNETELAEEGINSNVSVENEFQELEPSFNFEDYKEFPNYNLEDMGDFLYKKRLISLLNKDFSELSDTDMYNIGYIGLNYKGLRKDEADEEYDRRLSEVGDNPFKRDRLNEEIYQELKSYSSTIDENKKYVFNIHKGDYSYEHITVGDRLEDLPPVLATFLYYDSNNAPLDNYNMQDESFSLFSVNSISPQLEASPDIRQITGHSKKNDHTSLSKIYVSDRTKAERIQDLLDKNELGMDGKIYIQFIDSDDSSNELLEYDIDGVVLNFYDKKTNEIIETVQDLKEY